MKSVIILLIVVTFTLNDAQTGGSIADDDNGLSTIATGTEPESSTKIPKIASLAWSEMGLKSSCADDNLRSELGTIRSALTSCLNVRQLVMPGVENALDDHTNEDVRERDVNCHLAERWPFCWHYLDGLSCVEPPSPSSLFGGMYDHELGFDDPFMFGGGHFGGLTGGNSDNVGTEAGAGLGSMTTVYKSKCLATYQTDDDIHGLPRMTDVPTGLPYGLDWA